jgi:predicted  nucleic acid-binding Zn-ribbon protein
MDDRNYDFTTLSERISAQTQAYVEFSNALVKIIEQTAQIRDNVSENNNHLLEDYRDLNKKFQSLLLDLNKFFNENQYQHKTIDDDLDKIKSSLQSFENKLKDLINEMAGSNQKLFDMIEDVVDNSKRTKDMLNMESTDSNSQYDLLIKKIDHLSSGILEQSVLVSGFKKTIDKYKVFLWAAGALLAIVGVLSQFGIMSIVWFKK